MLFLSAKASTSKMEFYERNTCILLGWSVRSRFPKQGGTEIKLYCFRKLTSECLKNPCNGEIRMQVCSGFSWCDFFGGVVRSSPWKIPTHSARLDFQEFSSQHLLSLLQIVQVHMVYMIACFLRVLVKLNLRQWRGNRFYLIIQKLVRLYPEQGWKNSTCLF